MKKLLVVIVILSLTISLLFASERETLRDGATITLSNGDACIFFNDLSPLYDIYKLVGDQFNDISLKLEYAAETLSRISDYDEARRMKSYIGELERERARYDAMLEFLLKLPVTTST